VSTYYVNSQHMLIGPGVRHELVMPEAQTQPDIYPWSVILHSQSGPARTPWERLVAFMRRADIGMEAHFLVNMDGTTIQTMPLNKRADCNFRANRWGVPFMGDTLHVGAISFETQDDGHPTLATTPWTPPQTEAIASAVAAIGHKYGVPYTSPIAWNDRGVGFHSQFREWSSFTGKTCPGAARIRQMDWIRRRAAEICVCTPEGA
jgi:hypothetical protein